MPISRQWARTGLIVTAGLLFIFCLNTFLSEPRTSILTVSAEIKVAAGTLPSTTNAAPDQTSSDGPPAPVISRKAVVMGKLSHEDTNWTTTDELQGWESAVYVVDLPTNATSPTGLRTKMNKAKEAMPYLTYIIDHYNDLPDIAVFTHAHRKGWPQAWHTDARGYDIVRALTELRLNVVRDRGYVNLRCLEYPGCPGEINLNRNPPNKEALTELAYPYVYGQFFDMSVEAVREQVPIVGAHCCAQFAVSRDQILQRPREEYEKFVRLLEESAYDDHTLGGVMEYMWHILFGQERVSCMEHKKCWAELYGRKHGYSGSGGRGRKGG